MNAIFGELKTEGLEEAEDRLGGFVTRETDAYLATIKAAYAGKSAGGARYVHVIAGMESGPDYSETIYVTNKHGENFFLNKQDKTKKVPLPGFTTINHICLVTTNKSLAEQSSEEKTMNVYDPEAKKELPKAVPMLVELIGKQVSLGILKILENKSKKADDGSYTDTAETRETNSIDKVFHYPTGLTVVEATNGATEAVFMPAWVERNKGKDRDKRTIKDGASAQGVKSGRPGKPPQADASAPSQTTSLFG